MAGRVGGANDDEGGAPADTARQQRERAGGIDAPLTVPADGTLQLTAAQARRWGVTPGAEFEVEERPDGLFLRRCQPPLQRVYVEPTSRCNLSCRTACAIRGTSPSALCPWKPTTR
jgi:hypothetical protein